jgi:hypothetical protein
MSKQDNIAAQKRFGAAVNSGKLHEFKNLMTSDVKDHDPAPDQGPGPEGFPGQRNTCNEVLITLDCF